MKNLFYRLIIFLDTASQKDTNYHIAWYMAHHFHSIADMRISELASECFVSPATISRFCRALGYENFAHLKQECHAFHLQDRKFNNLINVPLELMRNDPQAATRQYVDHVVQYVSTLANILDWDEIDQTLQLIHESSSVAFFGTQFSQSAALHFQTDLLMLEKFTMAYMDSARQLECARKLTKDSVAIIITVNGFYLNNAHKILQYIKKSGCKVVLMTCQEDLKINIHVDHSILLGRSQSSKTGKHTLLTVVELMSLRYYSLYYPSLTELNKKIQK